MQVSTISPISPSSPINGNLAPKPFLGQSLNRTPFFPLRRRASLTTTAILTTTKELVLKEFRDRRALKIISGLQNFNKENVASVITAADKGGATHVDIACDPDLVKLAVSLTTLPVCVSSVDPSAFLPAVEAGAVMVEIGNYDSFYEMGVSFSAEQILKLTRETKKMLPSVALSVTVPHTLDLPDQVKLAEMLEFEGVDVIQTEGGKCSNPSESGVLGLIEKATPTLAAAYSISRAVKVPVLCSSGLSSVTAPMAITAGAAGVGVGSAVNKLNDVVAMIAVVRSIADSLAIVEKELHEKLQKRKKRDAEVDSCTARVMHAFLGDELLKNVKGVDGFRHCFRDSKQGDVETPQSHQHSQRIHRSSFGI